MRNLSLYLHAGIPIYRAFGLIAESNSRPQAVRLVRCIAEDIREGKTVADALAQFPRTFDPLVIGFIRIGEMSGALAEHATQIVQILQKRAALTRTILSAALYPTVIMLATFGITLFLTLYTFPKILPLFKGLHQELPLSTRVLITITTVLTQYWWLVILGVMVLCVLVAFALRLQHIRTVRDRVSLSIPLFGILIRNYYIALICRTLAALLERGVPFIVALELTTQTLRHSLYVRALEGSQELVRRGQRISDGFITVPHLFPTVVVQMIQAGEETGTLPESLRACAHIYEEYLTEQARLLSTLVEPALMIIMGLLVGFISLAIITPIYGLTQGISF